MTIDDVLAQAYNAASLPTLKKQQVNTDAAIYKFWLANRDIGVPLTAEIALDDGTTAVIFSTGKVAHWLSGESVELV
jgi:hypothetical protein